MHQRTLAIVGDLHYEEEERTTLLASREQLKTYNPECVFSLGDMGGYSHCGTERSFEEGHEFFSGFDVPFYPIIGNHDMECLDYDSDEMEVRLWGETFHRPCPYYTVDLDSALAVCLSQTRYRTNWGSAHDVMLDDEQVVWLERVIQQNTSRPIFVFSHAPILGSRLRVLQNLHLRTPNAWLNSADRPERFIQIVKDNSHITLWFSAHNHLGQDYADSIVQTYNCTFVHTGVMAQISRDGCHQSRLLKFSKTGFELLTVDHDTQELRQDWEHDYCSGESKRLYQPVIAEESKYFAPAPYPKQGKRIGDSRFLIHRGMLVEYTHAWQAPLGIVDRDCEGAQIDIHGDVLKLTYPDGKTIDYEKNRVGRYFNIFFKNPWLSS
jgi:hypothetical protein